MVKGGYRRKFLMEFLSLPACVMDHGLVCKGCEDSGRALAVRSGPPSIHCQARIYSRRPDGALHDIRKVRGLTPSALAGPLGVAGHSLLRWEWARRRVSLPILI